jgi:hypothetical protein
MVQRVEIASLDLRFEGYRLRNKTAERILLASISENGIRDPLQGVDMDNSRILLNGFKRYRCARKLGIGIVPYTSLSSDTAIGIIELLRMSNEKGLGILEQARLIAELKDRYQMSTADIAGQLEKSKAWVSVRSAMIKEISPLVMERIFHGDFPVYAYMYILRPFIRINGIKRQDIEEFVGLVAGHKLSIRDIELLARGYFKGSQEFREQLKKGDIALGLAGLRRIHSESSGCTKAEQAMLRDLELVQGYMQRVSARGNAPGLNTCAFLVQANLLTGGVLRQMDLFAHAVSQLHDRSGKAQSHLSPLYGGNASQKDRP